MFDYQNSPLPKEGKHIRLLTLNPGTPQDELHVQMYTTQLDAGLHYEALSYVWGSSCLEIKITVGVCADLPSDSLTTSAAHVRTTSTMG